ncbi:S41 family peptidase [Streptomyces sp. ST2-7A]|uniref:S41 family peptidase n=1 Tax=Streptomyces sp. ST2-7A TaxID=2907214 RepID=UPI001F45BE97|nr:S41 family peptidase [Streptomyces sp. ST2-7A]MCE7079171.1 PDZ domain-containing protein [Streptomyces sp. ST2-7A]
MTAPSYLRYPHPNGDLLTFVAEDDVWAAPVAGGRAWRVSADSVPVSAPRLSPDGEHIAWTSGRDGAPEVHLAAVDGGPSRRLTHWGSGETGVRGWLPAIGDDEPEILAITPYGQPSSRHTVVRAVPMDGGPSRVLPYGPVSSVAHGPDGAVLLVSAGQSRGRDGARWKRYRGGTAGKLWIDRDGSGTFERVHADLNGNLEWPMWVGGRIAFVSDHEDTGALYSSLPDGSDLRRHSPLDGGYARQAATDGERVTWMRRGELWLLESPDADEPRPLDGIRLAGRRTHRRPRPAPALRRLGGVAPDHDGRGSAVETRGTLHWLTHREGPVRALDVRPGVRARLPRVFRSADADGERVLWVTDAEGEDALAMAPAAPAAEEEGVPPRLLASGELGRVLELAVAPDGSRAAVAAHDGRLLLVDLADGAVHELDRSSHGDVDGLGFSPDSAWLVWSHPGSAPLRQLKLARVADREVVEATPLRFRDFSPAFTRDGRHLAFLSERTFDPIYDAHVFDLSFPAACRPHLLTLAAETPSPFGPRRHGRPVPGASADPAPGGADGDTGDGADGADGTATGGGEPGNTGAPATRVDVEGLADRIIPFPVDAGRYSDLRAWSDGVLWLRQPISGTLGTSAGAPDGKRPGNTVERYDLTRLRTGTLASDIRGFEVTGDGKRVLLRISGGLRLVPADSTNPGEDDEQSVTPDLGRVRLTVDPSAEWRQMFDETGRLMRDHFWRADMSGVDWDAVLAEYRPLVERVATHDDLVDLLWEVHGELGTSHAYVTPPASPVPAARRQGLLGADLARDADGTWRVERVLPSETSDPQARSPLAAPGVAVRAGDAILAVDGVPVDPTAGPGPLLSGTADRAVELTVAPADGSSRRHAVVVPLDSEEQLRYHDWVAGRRAAVRELSGGRLGYLHVPDMVSSGWAQLHRDLRIEMGREGLIVDVRENRGGHTSQLVIEKLARRIIGWDLPRHQEPLSYPENAPRGPIVAISNEHAGSDGDMVTAAIRTLGLGPVVGTRTWGGVIGIDMRYDLVDGTAITQPRYAIWLKGHEWSVENYGVEPDIEVPIPPHEYAAGRDPQLETAVRLALEELERNPAAVPPGLPPL